MAGTSLITAPTDPRAGQRFPGPARTHVAASSHDEATTPERVESTCPRSDRCCRRRAVRVARCRPGRREPARRRPDPGAPVGLGRRLLRELHRAYRLLHRWATPFRQVAARNRRSRPPPPRRARRVGPPDRVAGPRRPSRWPHRSCAGCRAPSGRSIEGAHLERTCISLRTSRPSAGPSRSFACRGRPARCRTAAHGARRAGRAECSGRRPFTRPSQRSRRRRTMPASVSHEQRMRTRDAGLGE